MDVNQTLKELREHVKNFYKLSDGGDDYSLLEEAREIIAKFEGLDFWIKNRGFLPKDWERPKLESQRGE